VGVSGAFTFVLHSHIPYTRLAGRWPHGEEWIHEAASETYIPLLQTLYDLKDEGVNYRLTLGMTPVLAEQLADPLVLEHFAQFLDSRIAAAQQDMAYFEWPETANGHLRYLAGWYKLAYEKIKSDFEKRFNRDLIGAFRRLQDEGYIEIITGAATHAYLPLLHDSAINAQIKAGISSYKRFFGRQPTGFWLPECAYRPGIEYFLAANDLKVFFSEAHTITGGKPAGVAAGGIIGPHSTIQQRYVIPPQNNAPERPASTFLPYYVSDSAEQHSGVAVIGRNSRSGTQVWSAETGYPGDEDYREFYRKAGTSGLYYWRVTNKKIDLGMKDYYHPDWAAYKTDQHAEHFVHLVGDMLRDFHNSTGKYGLVLSSYNTELFGHWWFEGVSWLGKVLRHLAQDPNVELTTASRHIVQHPPGEVLSLPEGSWGAGGTHFTWDNNETHWMWEPIHEAEARMAALALRFTTPTADEQFTLNQLARELLLLQSSDWQFLVTSGQAREYAIQRFNQHLERFEKLADSLEQGKPKRDLAEEYWELDKIFPDIDYRWFITRS
jgi:1,4-alpha-glucan branching enzyme